jgi:hypothetical protein
MDSTQIFMIEDMVKQLLYSNSLGKSSLWLFGNVCIILLFLATILFFMALNYKQRKLLGVKETKFIELLSKPVIFIKEKLSKFDLMAKVIKDSFYIEFGVGALLFAVLTHISIFLAIFLAVFYVLFRFFLYKKTLQLFHRQDGTVVPIGIYILFTIFLTVLIVFFNFMPALIEVAAEGEFLQEMQNKVEVK